MSIEEFWELVEMVHRSAPDDMEAKCRNLGEELRKLPLHEVLWFYRHFWELSFRAYDWGVWGAACVICDGCSDDSFMDFRATLISMGKDLYEAALADADSLAEFNLNPDWAQYEGYQYVAQNVYEEHAGRLPDHETGPERQHPSEPTGIPFNQWEMSKRFPKLVAKYGYKDSDWIFVKVEQEKAAKDFEASFRLANLMIESGIISRNGLIPPVRVVRQILRTGKSPGGNGFTWKPFELEDEGHFWHAVDQLENRSSAGPRFKLDVGAPDAADYEEWMESLKKRGLL